MYFMRTSCIEIVPDPTVWKPAFRRYYKHQVVTIIDVYDKVNGCTVYIKNNIYEAPLW